MDDISRAQFSEFDVHCAVLQELHNSISNIAKKPTTLVTLGDQAPAATVPLNNAYPPRFTDYIPHSNPVVASSQSSKVNPNSLNLDYPASENVPSQLMSYPNPAPVSNERVQPQATFGSQNKQNLGGANTMTQHRNSYSYYDPHYTSNPILPTNYQHPQQQLMYQQQNEQFLLLAKQLDLMNKEIEMRKRENMELKRKVNSLIERIDLENHQTQIKKNRPLKLSDDAFNVMFLTEWPNKVQTFIFQVRGNEDETGPFTKTFQIDFEDIAMAEKVTGCSMKEACLRIVRGFFARCGDREFLQDYTLSVKPTIYLPLPRTVPFAITCAVCTGFGKSFSNYVTAETDEFFCATKKMVDSKIFTLLNNVRRRKVMF